jgi:hypothetical protein
VLCAKAAAEDLKIDHLNIITAFLNPPLKEEVYIRLPSYIREVYPKLSDEKKKAYLKLNRTLYGLK